jgi:hypothetical protein
MPRGRDRGRPAAPECGREPKPVDQGVQLGGDLIGLDVGADRSVTLTADAFSSSN